MVAGRNREILGLGGRETAQLGLPGTPIDHSPVHIGRERGGAASRATPDPLQLLVRCRGRTSSAALRLFFQATMTSAPLLQAAPFIPSPTRRPKAPGPQIELDLDLDGGHRLPRTSGSDSEKFSVKLNHAGYFLGTGENRAYVGGSVVWYDQCEKVGWSADSVQSLAENLGYESEGRIKIYFCLPGWSVNTKGFLEIRGDFHSDKMIAAVNCGHQFLRLYLDHDDSITGDIWDDTVEFPVADLPAFISPNKQGRHVDVPMQMVFHDSQPQVKKTKRELAMEEANEDDNISVNSEDSDYEPEIIDSDNDVSDEDFDLKEDAIDEEEDYKGKQVHIGDNFDDAPDLPDSDEESIRFQDIQSQRHA